MTRLTITFEEAEIEALRNAAQREMRPTKDHLRYILRHALGLKNNASTPTKNQITANVSEAHGDLVNVTL